MAQINRFSRQAANPIFNPLSIEQLSLAPDTAARRDATAMQVASQIDREYDVMNVDAQATQGAVEGLDTRIDSFVDTMSERGVTNSDIKSLVKLKRDRDTMYSESGLIGRAQKAKTAFNQNKALLQRQFDKGTISADKYQASIMQAEQGYEGVQSGLAYQDYLANKDVNMADKALKYGLASVKNPNVVNYNGEDLTLTEDGKFYRSQTGNIKYAKEEVIAGKVREAMLGDQELMNDWQQREQLGMLGDRSLNDVISQSANATGKMLAFQQDNRKFNHVGNPGYSSVGSNDGAATPSGYQAMSSMEVNKKPYLTGYKDPISTTGTGAGGFSSPTVGISNSPNNFNDSARKRSIEKHNTETNNQWDKNEGVIRSVFGKEVPSTLTIEDKASWMTKFDKQQNNGQVKQTHPIVMQDNFSVFKPGSSYAKSTDKYATDKEASDDFMSGFMDKQVMTTKGKILSRDEKSDLLDDIRDKKETLSYEGIMSPMSGVNYDTEGKYKPNMELAGKFTSSDSDKTGYLVAQPTSTQNTPYYKQMVDYQTQFDELEHTTNPNNKHAIQGSMFNPNTGNSVRVEIIKTPTNGLVIYKDGKPMVNSNGSPMEVTPYRLKQLTMGALNITK